MSSSTMDPAVETEDEVNPLPLKELLFPGGDGDLVNTEGVKVSSDVIEGKILGIFVGPCWWKPLMLKNIIPTFVDAVKEIVEKGNPLQMVFVPWARDENLIDQVKQTGRGEQIDSTSEEESFTSFINSLPAGWLSVPLSNPQTIETLTEVTNSRVIGLAFVAADGRIITTDGRELLMDHGADAFPFSEERLRELEKPFQLLKENPSLKGLLETDDRDYVIRNDGTTVQISSLEGPIALYFSAHWCPPCQRFTPLLASAYKKLQDEGKHFEVVFVSWDRSEEEFEKYFKEMPWLALPFSDKKKKTLEKVYEVEGIPSLVILDSEGKTMQQDDVVSVISDFGTDAYPFTNKKVKELKTALEAAKEAERANQTLESVLVTEERDYVVDHEGKEVKVSSVVGKTVGLYFSAHWCPPCRGFTPKLADIYKELKEAGKPFEIIFISSDRDEEAFKEYFNEMPWLALPYNDRKLKVNTKHKLGEYFDVKGIPCLIVLGPDGKTVNRDGRATIEKFGAKGFPFVKDEEDDLLKKFDEEVLKLPVEVTISDHKHPLKLMRVPYPSGSYGCDICGSGASRWAYRCEDCGYDAELSCIKKILERQAAEEEAAKAEATAPEDTETNEDAHAEGKEGYICEEGVCRKV